MHVLNFKLFQLEIYIILTNIVTEGTLQNKMKGRTITVEIRETMTETDLAQTRVSQPCTNQIFELDNCCGKLSCAL